MFFKIAQEVQKSLYCAFDGPTCSPTARRRTSSGSCIRFRRCKRSV